MIRLMVVEVTRDRQAERREATRVEILEAAWELSRVHGLAGFSLRDVARKIGMRPPSLYWYFDSKQAVYDAMFAQANQQLLDLLERQEWPEDPRPLLRMGARVWLEFATEDVQRYQLLFQRSVPDFEPSPQAYALAVQVYELMQVRLAAVGLKRQDQLDMWTALVAGLAAQQTANDPDGDRWLRLVDEMVDMYADHVLPNRTRARRQR
jgi:AcrR family transcriptional regulator